MKLPNTLLLAYQTEYETTDISIEDLCAKYDIQTKQLKGYTNWVKRQEEPLQGDTSEVQVIDIPKDTSKVQVIDIPKDTEELLENVEEFKKLAVAHAVKFMKNDAEFAEVKEFKDMVAIVDSIEKSYKDVKSNEPTINVLIQNLTQKFRDTPDDC